MALDHYVSQVHLKNFCSPDLKGDRLFCISKKSLKKFTCATQRVCRIENGSTNIYLKDERIIENFLKKIEPNYNNALRALRAGNISHDVVFVVAGFLSYLLTCSPTSMRLNQEWLAKMLESTAKEMDEHGMFPLSPHSLGNKSLTELIKDGTLKFDVDKKYPQALGITNVLNATSSFGNSDWEIIVNPFNDSPFFSSDFPVYSEQSGIQFIYNRILPLAPDIALRIKPNPRSKIDDQNFEFPNHHFRYIQATKQNVRDINIGLVRSAEDQVYFRDDLNWVYSFVKKNSQYRLMPSTEVMPMGNGDLIKGSFQLLKVE